MVVIVDVTVDVTVVDVVVAVVVRVFAIYQIMLGWKTYKYYYKTDELPNPRPTQPKKIRLKVAFGPPLFSHSKIIFPWVGIGFI